MAEYFLDIGDLDPSVPFADGEYALPYWVIRSKTRGGSIIAQALYSPNGDYVYATNVGLQYAYYSRSLVFSNGYSVSCVRKGLTRTFKVYAPDTLSNIGHISVEGSSYYTTIAYPYGGLGSIISGTASTLFTPFIEFAFERIKYIFSVHLPGEPSNNYFNGGAVYSLDYPEANISNRLQGERTLVKAKWDFGDGVQVEKSKDDEGGLTAFHIYAKKSDFTPIFVSCEVEDNFGLKVKAGYSKEEAAAAFRSATGNRNGNRLFYVPTVYFLQNGEIAVCSMDVGKPISYTDFQGKHSTLNSLILGSKSRLVPLLVTTNSYNTLKARQLRDGRVCSFSRLSDINISIKANLEIKPSSSVFKRIWEVYTNRSMPGQFLFSDSEVLLDGSMISIVCTQVGQENPTMRFKRSTDGLNWPSWDKCPQIMELKEVDYYCLKLTSDGSILITNGYDKFYRLKTLDPQSEDDLEKLDVTQEQ